MCCTWVACIAPVWESWSPALVFPSLDSSFAVELLVPFPVTCCCWWCPSSWAAVLSVELTLGAGVSLIGECCRGSSALGESEEDSGGTAGGDCNLGSWERWIAGVGVRWKNFMSHALAPSLPGDVRPPSAAVSPRFSVVINSANLFAFRISFCWMIEQRCSARSSFASAARWSSSLAATYSLSACSNRFLCRCKYTRNCSTSRKQMTASHLSC